MSHRKQSKRKKLNKFIKNIFSIKSTYDKSHKIFTLFGIKLKIKNMSYKHTIYRNFSILPEILRYIGRIKYGKKIYINKEARICVCLHLYYMNSWKKIKNYLKNLSPYKYDLYVSCCEDNYNPKTLNKIRKFKKDAKINIYQNKGYDIGSFIETINSIKLSNYDIIFKIHSKGTKRPYIYIYNQIFKYADWFYNLYEGILGEFTVHETIDKLMNDKNIGLIASKNLIVSDPIHKQNFTKNIAKNFNIDVPDNYKFVAGTCFATKSDFLQPVQNYKFNINNFNEAQKDVFSLAHAMERIVCFNKNYILYGININYPKYEKERKKREKYSSIKLLYDKRFEIDYDFFYKALELKKIINYEIIEIKLKEIKRNWHGFIYSLYDVSPYKYLVSGSSELYNQYAFINKIESGFDMSEAKYKNLINSIRQNNFNPKKLPIINSDNIILDGQHRCCILMHKYGGEHTIPVLKINYTNF